MITFTDQKIKILEVYHIGEIGAGKVVPFVPRKKSHVIAPKHLQGRNPIEAIVSGDSLINLHIEDGDRLICIDQFDRSEVRQGSLCVISFIKTQELIVRRIFYNPDNTVTLKAANAKYPDKIYLCEDIEIKAIVVSIVKVFHNKLYQDILHSKYDASTNL